MLLFFYLFRAYDRTGGCLGECGGNPVFERKRNGLRYKKSVVSLADLLPLELLGKNIETTLRNRYAVVPEQILTYNETDGTYVSKPIEAVGTIESIRVTERGAGEIATRLLLVGSEGVYLIKNEYNIRSVLAPLDTFIYRENGEDVKGAALLPSAFITLQKGLYRGEMGYLVSGGGYGHGVGLSQCGADAMAKEGASCEEIIETYYPGTELGFIYE